MYILGFDQIAESLIQNGADVNARGLDNKTALTWASVNGKQK